MKIIKLFNAFLYFVSVVMALFSFFFESIIIQRIYWFFFGSASVLLFIVSIAELLIHKRKRKKVDKGRKSDGS